MEESNQTQYQPSPHQMEEPQQNYDFAPADEQMVEGRTQLSETTPLIGAGLDDDEGSVHISGSADFEASAAGPIRPLVKLSQPTAVTSEYLYETEKVQEAHAAATAERNMMPRLSASEREVSLYAEDEFNDETDYRIVDRDTVQKLERKLTPHRAHVSRLHNQSADGGGRLSQLLLDVVTGLTTRLAQSFSNSVNFDGGMKQAQAAESSYAFEDDQNADTQKQQAGAPTRKTHETLQKRSPQAVESDYVFVSDHQKNQTDAASQQDRSPGGGTVAQLQRHVQAVQSDYACLNDQDEQIGVTLQQDSSAGRRQTIPQTQRRIRAVDSEYAFLSNPHDKQTNVDDLQQDAPADPNTTFRTQRPVQTVDSDYAYFNHYQGAQTDLAPVNQPLQNEHIEASPRGTTSGKQSPSAYMFKTTSDADLMAIVEQVTQQMNATIKEDADLESQYVLTRRYGGKI